MKRPLIILAVICVIISSAALYLSLRAYPDRPSTSDFRAFYEGGRTILSGDFNNLYPNNFGYIHPPFEALLFAPFAATTLLHSYFFWSLLNSIALAALPFILLPVVPVLRRRPYLALCGFCFWPALNCIFMMGQDSILILVMLCVSYRLMVSEKHVSAGLVLGLSAVKFHFVILFCIFILAARLWKMLSGVLASCLALAAFSIAMIGPSHIRTYIAFLEDAGRRQNLSRMINALGFLYGVGDSRCLLLYSLIVTGLIVLLALSASNRAARSSRLELWFAISTTTAVLASPYVHFADMSLLLLPLLLICERGLLTNIASLILFFAPLALFVFGGTSWWNFSYLMFPAIGSITPHLYAAVGPT